MASLLMLESLWIVWCTMSRLMVVEYLLGGCVNEVLMSW
jgi:hypothetical protein